MRIMDGLGGKGPVPHASPHYGGGAKTKPRLVTPHVRRHLPGVAEGAHPRARNSHSVHVPPALAGDGRLERPAPRPRGSKHEAGSAPTTRVENTYPAGIGSVKGAKRTTASLQLRKATNQIARAKG